MTAWVLRQAFRQPFPRLDFGVDGCLATSSPAAWAGSSPAFSPFELLEMDAVGIEGTPPTRAGFCAWACVVFEAAARVLAAATWNTAAAAAGGNLREVAGNCRGQQEFARFSGK